MRRQVQVAALLLAAACTKGGGAAADAGPPYVLTVSLKAEALRADVRTREGFHVNAEYPVNFLAADGGRTQLSEQAKRERCGDEVCGLSVPLPNENGTFAFSVCSKETCLIEKVPISAQ